jgi:hypothetical protein
MAEARPSIEYLLHGRTQSKGGTMKKRIAMALGMVSLALMFTAAAQTAMGPTTSPLCKESLIRGTYAFTLEGQKLGGPGPVGSQVGVAMTTFDGVANLYQIDSVTIGGTKVSDFNNPPASGAYSVNSDCTGTFTIVFQDGRPTVTVNFVISQNGDEIDTVVVAPNVLATRSIGKRRFPGPQ